MARAGTDKIKVYLRIRPDAESEAALEWSDHRVAPRRAGGSKHVFQKVFGPKDPTAAVHSEVCGCILDALNGINGTVLAYGQTAAGKTHTMEGTAAEPGLVLLGVGALVKGAEERTVSGWEFGATASYYEVYNERVYDLLSPEPNVELELLPDADGNVDVKGLAQLRVASESDAKQLLDRGHHTRRTARTNLNEHSSRSHTVFQIKVRMVQPSTGIRRVATLRLVDLAGSENAKIAGTAGATKRDGGNINRSLLAVSNVIAALAANKEHVPYRDAKITRILKSSLGGNSRTAIICCVSPNPKNAEETWSTISFADRARVVYNCVKVNEQTGARYVPAEEVRKLDAMWTQDIKMAEKRELDQLWLMEFIKKQAKLDRDAECEIWSELDAHNNARIGTLLAKLEHSRAETAKARSETAKERKEKEARDETLKSLSHKCGKLADESAQRLKQADKHRQEAEQVHKENASLRAERDRFRAERDKARHANSALTSRMAQLEQALSVKSSADRALSRFTAEIARRHLVVSGAHAAPGSRPGVYHSQRIAEAIRDGCRALGVHSAAAEPAPPAPAPPTPPRTPKPKPAAAAASALSTLTPPGSRPKGGGGSPAPVPPPKTPSRSPDPKPVSMLSDLRRDHPPRGPRCQVPGARSPQGAGKRTVAPADAAAGAGSAKRQRTGQ